MSPTIRNASAGIGSAAALMLACATGAQEPAAAPAAGPAAESDPSVLAAEMMPLAGRSLILDVADSSDRAIAVGERGHILVSESRRDWRQVENVPTRSTLTAVAAVGTKAWAVGHDGVILHSADGGLTWTRQRVAAYDPNIDDPRNGVPFLDVIFVNENDGIAIGAYALMMRTSDGGQTWTDVDISGGATAAAEAAADAPAGDAAAGEEEDWNFDESELELDEETDPHLNGIARTGDGSLFIVAERGAAYRSTDGGDTWQRLQLPYEGSMFGVLGYAGRHVLAFGMRGRVFESRDLGDNWTLVDSGIELSLMGGAGWGDGGAALVGANGVVLTRPGASQKLTVHSHPDGVVLANAHLLGPDATELVVVGESGVSAYEPK
jgi:photosystem II stability/assembly factor-like uncharacterized protein